MLPDTATILTFGTILPSFVGILPVWLWQRDRDLTELGSGARPTCWPVWGWP